MSDLASRECAPCRGGVEPLRGAEVGKYLNELDEWEVVAERELRKAYAFENFLEALEFVHRVGQIAEAEGHHPDICFGWGRAELTLTTHDIGGLSENDFIVAAKIDGITKG